MKKTIFSSAMTVSACWWIAILCLTTTTTTTTSVSGFSPPSTATTTATTCLQASVSSSSPPPLSTPTTTLTSAIGRLSKECVAGVDAAHHLCGQVGADQLRAEVLFAGMVSHPEHASKTLCDFQIQPREVKTSATRAMQFKPSLALNSKKDTRVILKWACNIADYLESTKVRSEHVLLALMGYNYGGPITDVPVMEVLLDMPSLKQGDTTLSVKRFCEALVQDLSKLQHVREDEDEDVDIEEDCILEEIGVDMTELALKGKLDVVVGRDDELRTALRTLGRRRKNNPCLIGDPGVGKTAVVEALAQVLASGLRASPDAVEEAKVRERVGTFLTTESAKESSKDDDSDWNYGALPRCPKSLIGSRLIQVELANIVAATNNRGDFERIIKKVVKEAKELNAILFIDEIHNLIGAGGDGEGTMNAANLLKPALSRGELRLLGATTVQEYRRYIEKDGALERRFQPLEIKEPSVQQTFNILKSIAPQYEDYHGVVFTENALEVAAKLSDRYVSNRRLPDKAIDLIDEAGSMVKMQEDGASFYVTEDSIQEVISEITGIPLGKLDTGEKARLKNLEDELEKRIKGQHPAVRAVAKSIRRARSGMRDGKRPVASLMFCGPTGVGKTELCKALAETYYGQEKDMIRIDMSEYMDRFSTSRLIGAPPGYVGYEEGGQLTEAVRRNPHSVILFDELEKAHEDVLNLLLQIMDEGTLTDGKGRTVSFKNNIFVMTSNIGSKEIVEATKRADTDDDDVTTDVVKGVLEEAMKPELLSRIDEIIVFKPLGAKHLKDITKNLVAGVVERANDDHNIELTVSDSIADAITKEALGSSGVYGARPIRRAVQRYLEDVLAEAIMCGFIDDNDAASVIVKKTHIKVVQVKRARDGETMAIAVDDDAGISKESLDFQSPASGGPLKEPDAFQ